VSIPLYGLTSAFMVSLIEPIFAEVLLAGESAPAEPGDAAGATPGRGVADAAHEDEPRPATGLGAAVPGLSRFNLKRLGGEAYQRIKQSLGIDRQSVVWFVPLLFLAVFLLRSLTAFFNGYWFEHIGLGVVNEIRNDLFDRLLSQSSAFHSEHSSGEMAVASRLLDLFQQSVTLLILLGLLLSTNLQLALASLIGVPVFVWTIARFGRAVRKTSHRVQERMAEVTALLGEGLRGHRVVKAFCMEGFEGERFRAATRKLLRVSRWTQLLNNASSPAVELLAASGCAVLLAYAGFQIRAGEMTAPLLVQFTANLLLMYDPLKKLNKVNLVVQQARTGVRRVREVLDTPNAVVERPGATVLPGVREGIHFARVSFAYGDQPVLNEVDLHVRRGESVALVGPSGAGKTTLINLLPRFFDPTAGAVRIDGVDVREVTLRSLREQIGIVTQETVLFDDTIRNNIAYGRADLPLERVREAARAAYADDFIQEQPQGYDTRVGEFGAQLSGGQRQRLAIARALLKDPPILILDEATSQLDSESEALVQKALHNLMQDRTTLIVAHRLATVMQATRIVVMEGGRIVEVGTHAELRGRGGLYSKLYELQFRESRAG
jgi:subfamily B ATP-binding cassette protein MsbA